MTNAHSLYGGTDGQLTDDIANGRVQVAVYGLGKMGLPLAAALAERTGDVVGVDVDESVVEAVNAGESHVANEPGLADLVHETVDDGSLRATTDGKRAAANASVHVVVVPTKLHEGARPDLDIVRAVTRQVAAGLDAGDAVFLESTVPPGTCRDVVEPLLATESGLAPEAFGVAFCPERTSSGRALRDIRGAYPKVVGGTDPRATRTAQRFYEAVTDNEVIPVSDAATAEAVKVFEGVYRDVNIALANELGRVSERLEIDGREAIDVANTQPYCEIHDPGPGVGGHCIPFYPHFLMSAVDTDTPLIRTARSVNESMPGYTAGLVSDLLEAAGRRVDDATVLLLGVTYRPGVAETTHTPALPLARRLDQLGAAVAVADPLVEPAVLDESPATHLPLETVESLAPDAVVVVTPHEEFESLDWSAFGDAVVLDARDGLDSPQGTHTLGNGRRSDGGRD
ncbi:nucleotide sugar dehydrogenase [Salinigranum halophilum]|uniref:nucleotide sugar dehydrogenase n=1 Tax=Salinigranum halophilum TaxID=2565931 RepID=UPI0010A827C0|nr:nucleotide sugar dehydrogenase [Salinigranum halophilum]